MNRKKELKNISTFCETQHTLDKKEIRHRAKVLKSNVGKS